MPTRSLRSRVMKWPTAATVREAFTAWARTLREKHPRVQRIGYFGSYANGTWGVGSDLDVLVLVSEADRPFPDRPSAFDTSGLPVPVDLLVYTVDEWGRMRGQNRGPAQASIVWAEERQDMNC